MSTRNLPTGTVTFLFTDIEGSTRLLQLLGDRYGGVLETHARLVRRAVEECEGVEVSTEGDAFFCVFPSALQAVKGAVGAQRALVGHDWLDGEAVRVRMGLHSGEGVLGGDNYFGLDVHRAARIASAGHGSQVLISQATRALVEQALPPDVRLRDLGEHRLKDLAQPEHLYQLVADGLPSEFPPIRSLQATPNNLPLQLTSFVGREREVSQASQLLSRTRLLTLTGPGGTGKSRLSLQVAAEVAERFPDGVFFVPLAPVTDPELVPSTIVDALGLPQGPRPPKERLAEHLRDKRLLLVLDNFEQVLAAASQVSQLLGMSPDLAVLVTSRGPLQVSGEQVYPVPPLGVPDLDGLQSPDQLAHYEAVDLFAERAATVKPDFQLAPGNVRTVAEIAARLDGLPLAIELAAARVRLLTPQAILSRLENRLGLLAGGSRDLPTRQQTLRDAIAWSYDLLNEGGRRLFERMAVFTGGAGLDQAEEVCGAGLEADVLDGLALLVDQSLLRQQEAEGEPRFLMLETIREFALERLEQRGEAEEMRRRHAQAFLALAEEAEPRLTSLEQRPWLDRLAHDHDNLRAALSWSMGHDAETAYRLAAALWRFWQMRGHLHEARQRLEDLLALEAPGPALRARGLEAAGGVAYWQGDTEASGNFYGQSLELYRELGDRAGVANALYNLSFAYMWALQPDQAKSLLEESLGISRDLGDRAGVAKVLWALTDLYLLEEDLGEALRLASESLAIWREVDDPFGLGWALFLLAVVEVDMEDLPAARSHLEESLRLFDRAGDLSAVALHLGIFAL
ncbi:MAG: tetratricopeptide repeat protein, partial [Actinomycetota bacterium]|nr:tetratricopeptide repeat protein [Actinomycetota bacterium]